MVNMAGNNRLKLLSCETDYRLKYIRLSREDLIQSSGYPIVLRGVALAAGWSRVHGSSRRPVESAERVTFPPFKTNRAETERNTHSKKIDRGVQIRII